MPLLSVIMPAIRTERWIGMYESIQKSLLSDDFELIIVTEMPIPDNIKDKPNVKFLYSERSPMQKQQEGLCIAEGEFVTIVSDDSIFLPETLDKTFKYINPIKALV